MILRDLLREGLGHVELAVVLWIWDHGGRVQSFADLPHHRNAIAKARRALIRRGWLRESGGWHELAVTLALTAPAAKPTPPPQAALPATPPAARPAAPAAPTPAPAAVKPDTRTPEQRERDAALAQLRRR